MPLNKNKCPIGNMRYLKKKKKKKQERERGEFSNQSPSYVVAWIPIGSKHFQASLPISIN
jgi:hypothetical protein